MNTVKFDNGMHLKVEYEGAANVLIGEELRHLASHISMMNALVPLSAFSVKRKISPPTDYEYTMLAKDGRAIYQIVRVSGAVRAQSFASSGNFWQTEPTPELPHHTMLRHDVEQFIVQNSATKIDVTWD